MKGKEYLENIKRQATCPCGENRVSLLEFAHYDRESKCKKNGKTVNISHLKCQNQIEEELHKGRFLCVICHREETKEEEENEQAIYFQSQILILQKNYIKNGISCNGNFCHGRKLHADNFTKSKSKCDFCCRLEKCMKRQQRRSYINEKKIECEKCEYCREICTSAN